MSTSITLPKPSHSGQAPSGLLKLKSRGSGSRYWRPHSAQRIRLSKRTASQRRSSTMTCFAAAGEERSASRPPSPTNTVQLTVADGERRFERVAQPLRRDAAGEPVDDNRDVVSGDCR